MLMLLLSTGSSARAPRASGFLFVEEPVNPRLIAMGSAGTALGGTGFSYYNPAQPFFTERPYVFAEFGRISGDVNRGSVETAVVHPGWFGGISFITQSVDFTVATEQGTGPSAANQGTVASLTAGLVRDEFAAAVTLNGLQDRFGYSTTYYGLSVSGGMGYRLIPGRLNVGVAAFNLGRSKGFLDDPEWRKHGIPRTLRLGASYNDTLNEMCYAAAIDLVYRDETGEVLVPFGVEVYPLSMLALRLGKRFGHETEVFSIGMGVNLDNLSVDVSFVPVKMVKDYSIKWSAGLSYFLGARH